MSKGKNEKVSITYSSFLFVKCYFDDLRIEVDDNPVLNPNSLVTFFEFDKRTKKFKFRDLEFWFELKGEIPKNTCLDQCIVHNNGKIGYLFICSKTITLRARFKNLAVLLSTFHNEEIFKHSIPFQKELDVEKISQFLNNFNLPSIETIVQNDDYGLF